MSIEFDIRQFRKLCYEDNDKFGHHDRTDLHFFCTIDELCNGDM